MRISLRAFGVVGWVALFWFAPVASAGVVDFVVTKIADTSTPVPGGVDTFVAFDIPTASSFVGKFAGGSGLYSFARKGPANLGRIADTTTPIPGGIGNFTEFDSATWSVFRGRGAGGQEGLYFHNSVTSALSKVVDRNTPIPGGTGTFTAFGPRVAISPRAFYGEGAGGQRGIYSPTKVYADTRTLIPNRGGATFSSFGPTVGSGDAGIFFSGDGGLFASRDDGRTITTTPLYAGGVHTFAMGYAREHAPGFIMWLIPTFQIVLAFDDFGQLVDVANTREPVPHRAANYSDFTQVSYGSGYIEGGPIVAYRAEDTDGEVGLYAWLGRLDPLNIHRLIDTTMTLDGKEIAGLDMSDDAISEYSVTFRATFDDGTSGIYVSSIPEPAANVVFAAGLLVAIARRKLRPRVRAN